MKNPANAVKPLFGKDIQTLNQLTVPLSPRREAQGEV
jgi:hypothetical protein